MASKSYHVSYESMDGKATHDPIILIPAKESSSRAPGKNLQLLPYTLDYVKRIGREHQARVLTNCPRMRDMASAAHIPVLPEVSVSHDFAANFSASRHAAGWTDSQAVIILEPTKPFRERWLVDACISRHLATGGVVTTGISQPVTYIEFDPASARAVRHVGRKILDGAVVVATCGDFSAVRTMSDFWDANMPEVVWHHAPSGIDFDYPLDLECHLPTVSRMVPAWFDRTA